MKKSEQSLFDLGASEIRRGRYPCGQVKLEGFVVCPKCKIPHWVDSHNLRRKTFSKKCGRCTCSENIKEAQKPQYKKCGPDNHNFKRGYWVTPSGYVELTLPLKDPRRRFSKRGHGKIMLHRLVMAEHLSRPLESWEHVHHMDLDKQNNRLDNLELMSATIHALVTALTAEITKLKKENESLKNQLTPANLVL